MSQKYSIQLYPRRRESGDNTKSIERRKKRNEERTTEKIKLLQLREEVCCLKEDTSELNKS